MVVEISKSAFEAMKSHAERGYPAEVCGVMAGGGARVEESMECANLNTERAHDRYELDPASFNEADSSAREKGLGIVGIYHSHPDHPARPSETDRQRAWSGWGYLIMSVEKGVFKEATLWYLNEQTGQFEKADFSVFS
ncbi:MAG: M67 family metallopeptidase [Candidatus Dadabacteria bacterium]|nr:M67 family metallopeptidase [Candidatus Dadabacteria bacterium]